MKLASIQKQEQSHHLKVIKNESRKSKPVKTRLNINTLIPGFKYTNSKGEVLTPQNRVFL